MSFLKPVVLGLMAITVDLVCQPAYAKAQAGFPVVSEEVIVWSARSCYAEATWSLADCTALLHVIRKRAQRANWTFLKMLKQYSVSNWTQSSHGKRALRLKLAHNPKVEPELARARRSRGRGARRRCDRSVHGCRPLGRVVLHAALADAPRPLQPEGRECLLGERARLTLGSGGAQSFSAPCSIQRRSTSTSAALKRS